MTTELTSDERTRILRELDKQECFCGARKARMQAFCRPHHEALPDWMRNRLYQRAGDGYEEAYMAAREYFEKATKLNMMDYIVTPLDDHFRVQFHGVDVRLTHEQTIRLRDVLDKALRQAMKKDQRCAYNDHCPSAGTHRLVGVNTEFRVCDRHAQIMLAASSHLVDKSKR